MRRQEGKAVIPVEVREAFKRAVDLILPFKCPVCGGVADTNDRFGNYEELYEALYGTESELRICGKCLSAVNTVDEDNRWFLCLSNPVENDPCPGLALYMPFTYKGILERAVPRIKFGKKIELARNEYKILLTLMENKNKVVSREKLMEVLWETDSFVDENTLTVNVGRLRKTLEAAGLTNFIKTKFGVGYILEDE